VQAISEDAVSRLKKSLDLFQKGSYPPTLKIDDVVHIVNTRIGKEEVSKPFNPNSYGEVVALLQQLEKTGYDIKIENEKIRFTQYPKPY
jgi:hypothetical protein